jgi:hypothetical protein
MHGPCWTDGERRERGAARNTERAHGFGVTIEVRFTKAKIFKPSFLGSPNICKQTSRLMYVKNYPLNDAFTVRSLRAGTFRRLGFDDTLTTSARHVVTTICKYHLLSYF